MKSNQSKESNFILSIGPLKESNLLCWIGDFKESKKSLFMTRHWKKSEYLPVGHLGIVRGKRDSDKREESKRKGGRSFSFLYFLLGNFQRIFLRFLRIERDSSPSTTSPLHFRLSSSFFFFTKLSFLLLNHFFFVMKYVSPLHVINLQSNVIKPENICGHGYGLT